MVFMTKNKRKFSLEGLFKVYMISCIFAPILLLLIGGIFLKNPKDAFYLIYFYLTPCIYCIISEVLRILYETIFPEGEVS